MKPIMTDDLLDQVSRIYERARVEVLTLLRSHEPAEHSLMPPREWMSATQLAEYWQLYNEDNEPTTAGIFEVGEATGRQISATSRLHGRSPAIQPR